MTYGPRILPKMGGWSTKYNTPDRVVMLVKGLPSNDASTAAYHAVEVARKLSPKISGQMSNRIKPIFGDGFFGIWFPDQYTWFQDQGIRPFTMKRIAGKTIPMWLDDPDGKIRKENPKAQTRVTADGRAQTLIFRRAAKIGQRRMAMRRKGGQDVMVSVPASYPGAPGRIAVRNQAYSPDGHKPGQIAKGNIGVRWRHPGLGAREFIENGLRAAAQRYALNGTLVAMDGDRIVG